MPTQTCNGGKHSSTLTRGYFFQSATCVRVEMLVRFCGITDDGRDVDLSSSAIQQRRWPSIHSKVCDSAVLHGNQQPQCTSRRAANTHTPEQTMHGTHTGLKPRRCQSEWTKACWHMLPSTWMTRQHPIVWDNCKATLRYAEIWRSADTKQGCMPRGTRPLSHTKT